MLESITLEAGTQIKSYPMCIDIWPIFSLFQFFKQCLIHSSNCCIIGQGFYALICLFSLSKSRILLVMQAVASHKSENRMSLSAVAACMAPLVLRPIVAGSCELGNGFDSSGNGSLQFLKAASAANHAQAILITLLEEYGSIFEVSSIVV